MPDLSEQFGGSARAGLGELLPPRSAGRATAAPRDVDPDLPLPAPMAERPDEDAAVVDDEVTAGPDSSPEARSRPRTPSRRLQPAPAQVSRSQSFQVATYVRPAIKTAAQQRRARDRATNAEIAFEAIDATFSSLQQLLQHRRTVQRKPDSLFPARTRRRFGTSAQPETRMVPWVLQATADEIKVLDDLVSELGADSRSELIAVALEAHLQPKRR
ncbi:MAG: hypothetical protein L0I24_13530 [Pseudonocardia sp.]|nr:hypothetical protein [Pseudonocardia sp.]